MYFNTLVQNAILLKGPILLTVILFLMHLGVPSEIHYPHAHITLGGIALLQMAEAWIVLRRKDEDKEETWPAWREIVLIAGTVLFCYLFVWFTGRMQSKYGLIFLLPILSGSTRFPLRGAQLVTLTSVALYGSFYFTDTTVPLEDLPEETLELSINLFFSLFIGFLVNHASLQEKASLWRLSQAAEEVAAANEELRRAQEQLEAKVIELETMEQAIRRADRLAALGEMSAGLAHEIRSPLGVIQSSAEILSKKVRALEPDNRLVSVLVEEIGRINRLIVNFLAFASPPTPMLRNQDVNQIVQRAVDLIQPTAEKGGVRIALNLSGNLNILPVDGNMLHQCMVNLLMNAMDVIPENGTIAIEAVRFEEENEFRIAVRDSGSGILAGAESRIFNPFYTSKENGTGLGLAIVQQIMSIHGGRVEAQNVPGGGAVFTLCLPMNDSEVVAARAASDPQEISG